MSSPYDPPPPYYPQYPTGGPLSYAGVDVTRRPGLVTALAICSIVFGSLGVLYNAVAMMGTGIELAEWDPTISPLLPGTSADTTPAGTLTAEDARIIAAALADMQPLDEPEQQRLAETLQAAESPVAPPIPGVPWSAAHVKPQVVDSAVREVGDPIEDEWEEHWDEEDPEGRAESANEEGDPGAAPEYVHEERSIYFDFGGNGDITVYDDRVEFYSLPMEGGLVESTRWADGRLHVADDGPDERSLRTQQWATLLLEFLGLALAGLLLVAGILAIRDRPSAVSIHRNWAWSRIVLSVAMLGVGAWGAALLADDPDVGFMLGELYWPLMIVALMFQFILSNAYAVAVLIVLRTQRVREWYAIPTAGT